MERQRVEYRIGEVVVRIHRAACMGHADCMVVAPGVFAFGEDGVVTVRPDAIDPGRDRLALACDVCPEAALEAIGPDGMPLRPARPPR